VNVTVRLKTLFVFAMLIATARAAEPQDPIRTAEQCLAEGRDLLAICDYVQAEKRFSDARRIVESAADHEYSARANGVRMQSLRLLTHTYYPHM